MGGRPNAARCPECGGATYVYKTAVPFRYRKCRKCGVNYKTQEVYQKDADLLLTMADTALDIIAEVLPSG